ncbi:Hypothetical protein Minf_2017 [Methylacidiphilum infernorum V4]|uniref:Uncharacterized protein n=1 Tax=Methylacidiphilum infernorum (isolate V4) TaxID=481448 RepID=B3DYM3_METI4|nr:Hypothetical protein Minf_2017 [Methylacidiphilum infernorum V4]
MSLPLLGVSSPELYSWNLTKNIQLGKKIFLL